MSKIYKKGTTVVLKSTCNYAGCESEEDFTLERDMTEEELNKIAWDFATDQIQLEGYFELADEDEDEEDND